MSLSFVRPPENGIAISARDLQKTYDGKVPKTALHGMSLDIPAGSIFGLLGPNGAGKSTFINILAGTVIKTGGRACVWGADIDDNPRQARANIGIVPQELNIDAYFTPRETLEMQAGLFGVPPSERRSDAILEMVGLADQAHTYARRLSGGMRRRLLVAKAMVHAPPILVLDEPTAGVDVALRQQLWDNVKGAECCRGDNHPDNALSGRGRSAVRPHSDPQSRKADHQQANARVDGIGQPQGPASWGARHRAGPAPRYAAGTWRAE